MKYNLLSREECQEIVKKSEAFYCTETEVEGFKVEMYDYRLASHSDFVEHDAFELRGLTFVYNPNSNEWERHILMNKFFNVNQTDGIPIYRTTTPMGKIVFEGTEYSPNYTPSIKLAYERKQVSKTMSWMYEDLKDKKIIRVQDKLDGSVISFVKFPDGKIRAKSKMSFTSDQAQMAQEIYETNQPIRVMINTEIERGNVPIFELVGYENQVVLQYDNPYELRLIQIRNATTGEYANQNYMNNLSKDFMIETTQDLLSNVQVACNQKMIDNLPNKTEISLLDYLMEVRETIKGIEGWIITTEDNQMIKIKTTEYLQLHGLIGPDAFRENLLVQTILDDNIDDVISQLSPGTKRDNVIEITTKVQHEFDRLVVEFKNLRWMYFNKYNENKKEFAINHKNDRLFGYVVKRLNTSFRDVEKTAKEGVINYILNECKTLSSAKKYLSGL